MYRHHELKAWDEIYYPDSILCAKRYAWLKCKHDGILKDLNVTISKDALFYHKITDETLETAAQIFFYLTAPSQEYWTDVYELYSNWLEVLPLSRIVGTWFLALLITTSEIFFSIDLCIIIHLKVQWE